MEAVEQVDHGVAADHRPPVGVRISPHFYNTTDEIDAIMSEINTIVAKKDYVDTAARSLVT